MFTHSTAANSSIRRHTGRRVALRVVLAAGAIGVAGLGPLAATASASCPEATPACAVSVRGLTGAGPSSNGHGSFEQPVTAGVDGQRGVAGVRLPTDVLGVDPGTLALADDAGQGGGHVVIHEIGENGAPTTDTAATDSGTNGSGTSDTTTSTTTSTVPADSHDAERAGSADSLAFTGGGTQLAVVGAGLAALGAVAVAGTAVARRRNGAS